ncbi:unnamed protein product [Periconia digitata]|uniref:Nucleolar 27S pre-rRNA processing Urb2/Npa2 C-terminal domain-containing protein n=1 Tax=Periconia digitata TaxID=1303443 RepID=A0A9W4UTJ3_9PLEO|nr:unnamed protein product [Periconia digitata]
MGIKMPGTKLPAPSSASSPSQTLPPPTRPRLQAINQGSGDLSEQIGQAAHIIGLPTDWEALRGYARATAIHRLVPARADWVLKWILEKMKDAAARANPSAWVLLDWMIQVLPISRCAPHLLDSSFVTILEQTLQETFGTDALAQPSVTSSRTSSRDSSETSFQDSSSTGRKRKRGAVGVDSPSKRASLESDLPMKLFDAVKTVMHSVIKKSEDADLGERSVQGELMKIVLQADSSQAARVLKSWLIAANRLLVSDTGESTTTGVDLIPILELWDSRAVDTQAQPGASTEDFAAECLIPTLVLLQALQTKSHRSDASTTVLRFSREAIISLERLLVRHVIAPARSAFLGSDSPKNTEKNPLSNNLGSLRAALLQAAQMEDNGDVIPTALSSLFTSAPHLLDLTIRSSPARSLKSKVSERPWVQAAFVALAECIGCVFEAPKFATPQASIDAVKDCLRVLVSQDFGLDSDILKDLFWFHSGFEFPKGQTTSAQWQLLESIVALDADIFLADPRSTWESADEKPDDLTLYLFEKISTGCLDQTTPEGDDKADDSDTSMTSDTANGKKTNIQRQSSHTSRSNENRDIMQRVVIPILSAYTRNRDLPGFIKRWDTQLSQQFKPSDNALEVSHQSIWESSSLSQTLATYFEQSLTSAQISSLFQEHVKRLQTNKKTKKGRSNKIYGSIVLVQAMLQAVTSDGLIESLKPQILSVWNTLSTWVQDEPPPIIRPGVIWSTLCRVFVMLWPMNLHSSQVLQQEQLYPLIKEASKVAGSSRSNADSRTNAMAFMLSACDCLQTLPETKDLITKSLRRALKFLSSKDIEQQDLVSVLEIFCAEYVLLLEHFDPDARLDLFAALFATLPKLTDESARPIVTSLSEPVFTLGSQSLQTTCITALLSSFAEDNDELLPFALDSLQHVVPSSIPREQRESILDGLLSLLVSETHSQNACTMLSIMVNLMEVANATAKVSSNGSTLFDLAQNIQQNNIANPLTLELLQSLTRLTLVHILPNKDQSQNKLYLEAYMDCANTALKKGRKTSSAALAVLQGSFLANIKGAELVSVDSYVKLLIACLEGDFVPTAQVMEAFKNIPAKFLMDHPRSVKAAQSILRTWQSSSIGSGLIPESATEEPIQFWPAFHGVLGPYQVFEGDDSDLSLVRFTSNLLAHQFPGQQDGFSYPQQVKILESFKTSLSSLDMERKENLLGVCLRVARTDATGVAFRLLNVLISTMEDKLETDTTRKEQQLALLPQLCTLLECCSSDAAFNAILDSIITIVRDKTSLTTQHTIECVLASLSKLTSRNSPRLLASQAPAIFTRICETTRLIFILHRSRLGGRFHVLLPLLQNLLLCLFIPNTGRGAALPPWLDPFSTASSATRLTPANGATLTRLLTTLCSPTQSSVTRHTSHKSKSTTSNESTKKDLNDPIKAARDYTAQFAYPLLSAYCRFQLYGRLDASVRVELLPGIWELVSVASVEREALDAMFAGLGQSERDVWRGVWRDWEASVGGRGRKNEEY